MPITNYEIMCRLASRIKEYRLYARISQVEMAERSGVSLATIAHFEQGRNLNITLTNFVSILKVLGYEEALVETLLPELPVPPMALKEINKLIPKRARKKS